jgi:Formate/nitrite family of transporters
MIEEHENLTPHETFDYTTALGVKKVHKSISQMLILGFIAGVFIALASYGSIVGSHSLTLRMQTYAIGKFISGLIFTAGLILVLVSGGELFTGNSLIIMGVLQKKVTLRQMLRNWFFVYIGNFFGSLFTVALIIISGVPQHHDELALASLQMAITKVNYSFPQGLALGVLCNILVAAAVWMSYSSTNILSRAGIVFFPIMLFITSGYEHSIADMFYIPYGMALKGEFADTALAAGTTVDALAKLNLQGLFLNSLLPVTLGNIIGGCVFIGGIYWFTNKD